MLGFQIGHALLRITFRAIRRKMVQFKNERLYVARRVYHFLHLHAISLLLLDAHEGKVTYILVFVRAEIDHDLVVDAAVARTVVLL